MVAGGSQRNAFFSSDLIVSDLVRPVMLKTSKVVCLASDKEGTYRDGRLEKYMKDMIFNFELQIDQDFRQ